MFLVTCATGNVGSHVVQELTARRAPVRAFVRDPERAGARLGGGIELAAGDFEDPASVRAAMRDVDAVFLISANGPREVEHETAVIDAAADAGVRLVVKLSGLGARAGSPLPALDWHGQIEEHLRRAPVPGVVLQANFFMSNLFSAVPELRQGMLVAPAGDARIAMIDPRDVAASAAAVLTAAGPGEDTIVLTGPEPITYAELAEQLSRVTGRPVEFVRVSDEDARQAMMAARMPDWLVSHLHLLFKIARAGALAQVTDSVRALTGREPRTFAEFARDHRAVFAP
jgi:uncharacterized protein YbjT (DUF2867 family)